LQPDFWDSPGYVVAGWQDTDSHPTLAQRLVSDLLLTDEPPTSLRAIHERLLAAQVTARYGQERVIEWYLNSADYGHYAYGAEAAARLYLGKSAAELTLSEAALLAAVGQAPALNPFDAPQAAEADRLEALRVMLSLGWITPEEANQAVNDPPVVLPAPASDYLIADQSISPQFVDYLLRQLDAALGAGRVERGGAVVRTSLDYDLQLQADCALRNQLSRLARGSGGLPASDGSTCESAALLPDLTETFSATTAGATLLDPSTGQVLAAVGDVSPQLAGTTITPFIYLTGFARGLNPASLAWDLPGAEPVLGQVYQGPVRLRTALLNDILPPAETVLGQMGAASIRQTAASFGLDLPSIDLLAEDFSVSPFDLASAYAIFAAEGTQSGQQVNSSGLGPSAILQVTAADGDPWLDWSSPERRSVVSPQLAYLMNHVLSDESGRADLLDIGRPAAVKASSTLDGQAAWTVGYTPQRAAAVYLAGAGSGSRPAADGLWSALIQYALRDFPSAGWEMPAGVVMLKVCDPSGLLPTEACPNVVDEVFLEGRQPMHYDTLYQAFEINLETGLLATVFTPAELVESRVYMVVPPEARAWAAAAGLDTPPSTYDTYQTPEILAEAHITTPVMFSDEHGIVEIRGTAAGADFVSYRLEYGAGLDPQTWTLFVGDATTPVTEGLLANWDTTGLDGLYVVRLMVVRSENRVDEALVQVTLDNTPPEVVITYPLDGQELSLAEEPQVALQAQVQDAFLTEVVFYVDGEEMGSISAAPFGVLWQAEMGEHVLRVTATDRAGNVGEAEMRYSVKK
ncbi:MAG: penicillin-binding protein, partial [Chloroflexota bacterium]